MGGAKAAKEAGYITSYRHAFGLKHALGAIVVAPVLIGIGWYESMFDPTHDGELVITPNASIVGGHELFIRQLDAERFRVYVDNSWSDSWAVGGRAWMSWDTFGRLLSEKGDVTQLVN